MAFSLTPLAIQVYLVLWISSFVDSGYLESEEVSKKLIAKLSMLSVVFLLPLIPLVGKAVDKVSHNIMIPIAFFIRMIMSLLMVFWVKVPDQWELTFVIVGLTVATAVEHVSILGLFTKSLPSDARGASMGVLHFFTQLG